MIAYRRFRNTDPPSLVDVWNEAATGRGAYPLRTPALLERWVFSKPYFDHDSLIVAEHDNPKQVVGWALAGFGPNADRTGLDRETGVISCTLVRPSHRRHGIGRELVQRAEAYLTDRGAKQVVFGSMAPENPYLFGLYGGARSPGVLDSEPHAEPFLKAVGYGPSEAPADTRIIFQRKLDEPLATADPRFAAIRRKFDVQFLLRGAPAGSWWTECVWGTLEPSELRLVEKGTQAVVARAVVWELEGFSWRWGYPSAGLFDVRVREDLRRQGFAKLMLLDMLRFLQEQFFGVVEFHAPAEEPAARGMAQALGFHQVDTGRVYRRVESG